LQTSSTPTGEVADRLNEGRQRSHALEPEKGPISRMTPQQLHIGCAGWAIPKQYKSLFPQSGSHLERYAQRLTAVEINSSFYRPHRRTTYEGWAAAVPEGFAFSVKAPKMITHELRLLGADAALARFLGQASGLGDRLGPLLFQLPPSLGFDLEAARSFFAALRACHGGAVVCEPRHPDWFAPRANDLLREFRISLVAADPPIVDAAAGPGGWNGLLYFRLHGAPRKYYSEYGPDEIERFARQLARAAGGCPAWCIFDNTAAGAAIRNALALQERLREL
jgi:uncharacterized protein YecE (DUF72 family)